jgi:hypothetical protein
MYVSSCRHFLRAGRGRAAGRLGAARGELRPAVRPAAGSPWNPGAAWASSRRLRGGRTSAAVAPAAPAAAPAGLRRPARAASPAPPGSRGPSTTAPAGPWRARQGGRLPAGAAGEAGRRLRQTPAQQQWWVGLGLGGVAAAWAARRQPGVREGFCNTSSVLPGLVDIVLKN